MDGRKLEICPSLPPLFFGTTDCFSPESGIRRFRKKRKCYGLISGSRDGAWLETFYGWAGIRAIRGSKIAEVPRRPENLFVWSRVVTILGITPDGSRGPKYQAKSGALLIARASRSPVVLLSFSYGWAIRLKSWDQFVIPYPSPKFMHRQHFYL